MPPLLIYSFTVLVNFANSTIKIKSAPTEADAQKTQLDCRQTNLLPTSKVCRKEHAFLSKIKIHTFDVDYTICLAILLYYKE